MLPLDFFKSIKGIAILVGFALILMFLGYRSCNKFTSEVENENIEVIEIDAPLPGDYDANCLRITNEPCPDRSK